jgi:hypothetical protein
METARDIAIIIVAFQSIIIGILMAILVIQVIRLVNLLRHEIMPIVNSTQETVGTVRGTAGFVSDHLVQPLVSAASFSAGARRAVRTLFGLTGGRSRPS